MVCTPHAARRAAQDNLLHGRFLAELTQEVLSDLEASKYQHAEYRISIYGRKRVEWDILAAWICQNQLYSDNVIWLIQARWNSVAFVGACAGEFVISFHCCGLTHTCCCTRVPTPFHGHQQCYSNALDCLLRSCPASSR